MAIKEVAIKEVAIQELGGMPLANPALSNLAPILITSFRPWKAHQVSNSSDDLLAALHPQLVPQAIWLRRVPVSFQMAPILVANEIYRLRPRLVICCGMAEGRSQLALEAQARSQNKAQVRSQAPAQINNSPKTLTTPLQLSSLLTHTRLSKISYDAGDYVCNHLYYRTLDFINKTNLPTAVLFIHIPVLSIKNKKRIMTDFLHIYSKLSTATGGPAPSEFIFKEENSLRHIALAQCENAQEPSIARACGLFRNENLAEDAGFRPRI